MQPLALNALAQTITEGFGWRDAALCRELLRQLAGGQPVAPAQLATSLNRAPQDVITALHRVPDTEFDHAGNVVGWGLTLVPTPHQMRINGNLLYTWCALDTLFFPLILQQRADVTSPCPVTGELVRLTVSSEGIENLVPATAAISIVQPTAGDACSCNRENFCQRVHFFTSPAAAATWQQSHLQTRIVSVPEAYKLGQGLATAWCREADSAS